MNRLLALSYVASGLQHTVNKRISEYNFGHTSQVQVQKLNLEKNKRYCITDFQKVDVGVHLKSLKPFHSWRKIQCSRLRIGDRKYWIYVNRGFFRTNKCVHTSTIPQLWSEVHDKSQCYGGDGYKIIGGHQYGEECNGQNVHHTYEKIEGLSVGCGITQRFKCKNGGAKVLQCLNGKWEGEPCPKLKCGPQTVGWTNTQPFWPQELKEVLEGELIIHQKCRNGHAEQDWKFKCSWTGLRLELQIVTKGKCECTSQSIVNSHIKFAPLTKNLEAGKTTKLAPLCHKGQVFTQATVECRFHQNQMQLMVKEPGSCQCTSESLCEHDTYSGHITPMEVGTHPLIPSCINGEVHEAGAMVCEQWESGMHLRVNPGKCKCNSDSEGWHKAQHIFETAIVQGTHQIEPICNNGGVHNKAQVTCESNANGMRLVVKEDTGICTCNEKTHLFTALEVMKIGDTKEFEPTCMDGSTVLSQTVHQCDMVSGQVFLQVTQGKCKCDPKSIINDKLYKFNETQFDDKNKLHGTCASDTKKHVTVTCNSENGQMTIIGECMRLRFQPQYENTCTPISGTCGNGYHKITSWKQGPESKDFTFAIIDYELAKKACHQTCWYKAEYESKCTFYDGVCGKGYRAWKWMQGAKSNEFTYESMDNNKAKRNASCEEKCGYKADYSAKQCMVSEVCGDGHYAITWTKSVKSDVFKYDHQNADALKDLTKCSVACGFIPEYEKECTFNDGAECGAGHHQISSWLKVARCEASYESMDAYMAMKPCEDPCKFKFEVVPDSCTPTNGMCGAGTQRITWTMGPASKGFNLDYDDSRVETCNQECTCETANVKQAYLYKFEVTTFTQELRGKCQAGGFFHLTCDDNAMIRTEMKCKNFVCQDTPGWEDKCATIAKNGQCGNTSTMKMSDASLYCCACGKTLWTFERWSKCHLQHGQECGIGYKTAEYQCALGDDKVCGRRPYALSTCQKSCGNTGDGDDDSESDDDSSSSDSSSSDSSSSDVPCGGSGCGGSGIVIRPIITVYIYEDREITEMCEDVCKNTNWLTNLGMKVDKKATKIGHKVDKKATKIGNKVESTFNSVKNGFGKIFGK